MFPKHRAATANCISEWMAAGKFERGFARFIIENSLVVEPDISNSISSLFEKRLLLCMDIYIRISISCVDDVEQSLYLVSVGPVLAVGLIGKPV